MTPLAQSHSLHHFLEDDLAQQLERTARRRERGREVVVRLRLGELRRLGGRETELGEPHEAPHEQSLVLGDLVAGHGHEALGWVLEQSHFP